MHALWFSVLSFFLQSNEEFLMSYGFCLDDNVQDYVAVALSIHAADPLAHLRTRIVKLCDLSTGSKTALKSDSGVSLCFGRVLGRYAPLLCTPPCKCSGLCSELVSIITISLYRLLFLDLYYAGLGK
jgi:hypothetical protein